MHLPPVREAQYRVNRHDDKDAIRYRVLAMVLCAIPFAENTRGIRNLDTRLSHALFPVRSTSAMIRDHFLFHPQYMLSPQIIELLSAHHGYGTEIGLENRGPDFRYFVTPKTYGVAEEVAALHLLSHHDLQLLQRIGENMYQ